MVLFCFVTYFPMGNSEMKLEWILNGPFYLCPYVQVALCVCVLAGTCACINAEGNFICHFGGCHCRVCRVVSISWSFRWYVSTAVS